MFSSIKRIASEHSDVSVNFGKCTQIITPQKSSNTNTSQKLKRNYNEMQYMLHTQKHIFAAVNTINYISCGIILFIQMIDILILCVQGTIYQQQIFRLTKKRSQAKERRNQQLSEHRKTVPAQFEVFRMCFIFVGSQSKMLQLLHPFIPKCVMNKILAWAY